MMSETQANSIVGREIHDYGDRVVQKTTRVTTQAFDHPTQIGDSYYNQPTNLIKKFENTTPKYSV